MSVLGLTKLILGTFGLCCGPINSGFILAFSSPALRDLIRVLSVAQMSTFTSIIYVGGVVGSLSAGWLMDRRGRRAALVVSALPTALGWLMLWRCGYVRSDEDLKNWLPVLHLARLLGGVGCGMNIAVTAVYLVEVATTSARGCSAALNQLGITLGILLCYVIGSKLPYGSLALAALVVSLVQITAALLVPESPRWLLKHKQVEAARVALKRLRPRSGNCEVEMEEMMQAATQDGHGSRTEVTLRAMFGAPYRSRTRLIIQLLLLQQLSGINVFISYADVIFLEAVPYAQFIHQLPTIIGLFQFVFTIISTVFMDSFGRKFYLKLASVFMASSLFMLTYAYKMDHAALLMLAMILYIVGFSLGWGPVPMIVATEMVPQEARSGASTLAVITCWAGSYITTMTFPLFNYLVSLLNVLPPDAKPGLVSANQGGSVKDISALFIFYGCICVYSYVFVSRDLPETRGKSLDTADSSNSKKNLDY